MTVENQSSIRFSVEESIWFQRGQEVAELLSMSLDPEIIIQEHDQYISVRGGLILTGEYHADDSERESAVQPAGARTVQEVDRNAEGLSLLRHKFPIDITIPKNRIQNLNDVYVTIESFDYELPQRGNLQLEAELSITGIYEDQERSEEAQTQPSPQPVENVEEDTAIEEVVEEVEEVVNEVVTTEELDITEEVAELAEEVEEELVQPLMRGSFNEDEDLNDAEEGQQDPYTPFVVEAKRDPAAESADGVLEEQGEVQEEEIQEAPVLARKGPQLEFKSRVEEPKVSTQVEEQESDGSVTKRDENALYLTKIFANDNDSDTTKLKMCIVQKDETLELIAERYAVQPQTLIRVNNLDREHLAEGQILYIPVAVGSLK
ncbi:stage VI sporulation protein D [Bacillus mesophilus]|uniref:Stage VI sporulation protein D n=1 Tax=Bacillus mesophilus TaxID=1808955 RepID=A0A6M0Q670_9BACI|nr:stage VI sporulation protein D [Bacillus mesophilus]MBM7660645.1 stage VI sporulation protein D [Bacillus mesophilus]NEY71807.1 stage VI sporulation protein D [Bacillus mesophilus]